ncbi:hypothetical protein [Streptomyces sp. NPDC004726]
MRSRQDRDALFADRTAALTELTRQSVGPARLALFLLVVAGSELGWALVSTALISLEDTVDAFTLVFSAAFCVLALPVLVPSGIALVIGVRRDRAVRDLLRQWGDLDRDPVGDARFQWPGMTSAWLLLSLALTTTGLWLTVTALTSPAPVGGTTTSLTTFLVGTGVLLCAAGVLGLTKTIAHHRWAAGLLTAVPSRERGGAHR